MTEKGEIYRCRVCDNIIEVIEGGEDLVCCQAPMLLLKGEEEGMGMEKHLPILEEGDQQVTIKVGEIPHPMEEEHCIEWIEVQADDKVYVQNLNPGDEPKTVIPLDLKNIEKVTVRSFCNIHGLWKSGY
jgi:superoxide reductase